MEGFDVFGLPVEVVFELGVSGFQIVENAIGNARAKRKGNEDNGYNFFHENGLKFEF